MSPFPECPALMPPILGKKSWMSPFFWSIQEVTRGGSLMIWDSLPLLPPRMPVMRRLAVAVGVVAIYSLIDVHVVRDWHTSEPGQSGAQSAIVDTFILSV